MLRVPLAIPAWRSARFAAVRLAARSALRPASRRSAKTEPRPRSSSIGPSRNNRPQLPRPAGGVMAANLGWPSKKRWNDPGRIIVPRAGEEPVQAVLRDELREEFYHLRAGDNVETRRKAFSRLLQSRPQQRPRRLSRGRRQRPGSAFPPLVLVRGKGTERDSYYSSCSRLSHSASQHSEALIVGAGNFGRFEREQTIEA